MLLYLNMEIINFGSDTLSWMFWKVVGNSLEEAWRCKCDQTFYKCFLFSKHTALFFIYPRSIFLISTLTGKISVGVHCKRSIFFCHTVNCRNTAWSGIQGVTVLLYSTVLDIEHNQVLFTISHTLLSVAESQQILGFAGRTSSACTSRGPIAILEKLLLLLFLKRWSFYRTKSKIVSV